MIHLFTPAVYKIFDALDNQVRLVGGAVRDSVRDIVPTDIDMATPLSPETVMEKLKSHNISVIPTGIAHGTVTAVIDHIPYEITTLRNDVSTDGRHADVAFTDSYEQDAKRRDFTVNALYMDRSGQVYDYYNGLDDLKNHIVRFIGNPKERIEEDYLRILRYFRFWGKLDSFEIDTEALSVCQRLAKNLNHISWERRRDEFFKILLDKNAVWTLKLMEKWHILEYIIQNADMEALDRLLKVYPGATILERLAVLNCDIVAFKMSKTDTKILHKLRQTEQISHDTKQAKLALYRLGLPTFRFYAYKMLADGQVDKNTVDALLNLTVPIFPLKGQDLIETGFSSGPRIQQLLDKAVLIWADLDFIDNKKLVLNKLLEYNESKE